MPHSFAKTRFRLTNFFYFAPSSPLTVKMQSCLNGATEGVVLPFSTPPPRPDQPGPPGLLTGPVRRAKNDKNVIKTPA
jgi:hypothetical protein